MNDSKEVAVKTEAVKLKRRLLVRAQPGILKELIIRNDIKKVLSEKGKGGSQDGKYTAREYRRTYKHKLNNDPDETRGMLDTVVSMRGTHDTYNESKHSQINTNVLERYLRSRVGDNWDQVYSDIKEKTKNYWAGGYSCNGTIDDLLHRFLIKDTYMEGNVMMVRGYIGRPCNIWECYYGPFYIDPRDKTLQVLPKKRSYRYRRVVEPNKLAYVSKSNPLIQYHKIKQFWYEIKLREATPDELDRKEFGHWARFSHDHFEGVSDYSSIVSVIMAEPETHRGYGFHIVGFRDDCKAWCQCRHLFSPSLWGRLYNYWAIDMPNYFPISKRQISTKEMRNILKLIEERDKDAGN